MKRGARVKVWPSKCEGCGSYLRDDDHGCSSCELYNAAVTAVNAAAQEIATNFHVAARDAWLNEHGVFAWIGKKTVQVGTPYEAAPFMKLITAARGVVTFQKRRPTSPLRGGTDGTG